MITENIIKIVLVSLATIFALIGVIFAACSQWKCSTRFYAGSSVLLFIHLLLSS